MTIEPVYIGRCEYCERLYTCLAELKATGTNHCQTYKTGQKIRKPIAVDKSVDEAHLRQYKSISWPDGTRYGRHKRLHTLLAEKVLGRPLRKPEEVHHMNGSLHGGALVICPTREYHFTLHARKRAYDACGDPHKRKCWICKEWDSVAHLLQYGPRAYYHRVCKNSYDNKCRPKKTRKPSIVDKLTALLAAQAYLLSLK